MPMMKDVPVDSKLVEEILNPKKDNVISSKYDNAKKDSGKKQHMVIISNKQSEKNFKNIAIDVLSFVDDMIASSLGPYGFNCIIQKQGEPLITRDGYTILKHLHMANPESNIILELVRKIAFGVAKNSGDGTSSASLIASKTFHYLNELKNSYTLPSIRIIQLLDEFKLFLTTEIYNTSRKITTAEEIKNVAYIASNNDIEIANIFETIAKDYGFDVPVSYELGINDKTVFEVYEGYDHERGYTSDAYLYGSEGRFLNFAKTHIYMTNGVFGDADIQYLANITSKYMPGAELQDYAVLFMATSFSGNVKRFMEYNKAKFPVMKIAAVDIAFNTELTKELFSDLALYVGAVPIDKTKSDVRPHQQWETYKRGTAEKVFISDRETKFIGGGYDIKLLKSKLTSIDDRIDDLKKMDNNKHTYDKVLNDYEIRKRKLAGTVCNIVVGGVTYEEREQKLYLVEDTVLAVKSAIKNGYVQGGNLSLAKAAAKLQESKQVLKDISVKLSISEEVVIKYAEKFANAYKYPYVRVLLNSGLFGNETTDIYKMVGECVKQSKIFNLRTNAYESFTDTVVINPTDTEIEILRAVTSIIGLLTTSNQMLLLTYVANNPEQFNQFSK